jgi:hypothetical protein
VLVASIASFRDAIECSTPMTIPPLRLLTFSTAGHCHV